MADPAPSFGSNPPPSSGGGGNALTQNWNKLSTKTKWMIGLGSLSLIAIYYWYTNIYGGGGISNLLGTPNTTSTGTSGGGGGGSGPAGPTGPTGPAGKPGATGNRGPSGHSKYSWGWFKGQWGVWYKNGFYAAQSHNHGTHTHHNPPKKTTHNPHTHHNKKPIAQAQGPAHGGKQTPTLQALYQRSIKRLHISTQRLLAAEHALAGMDKRLKDATQFLNFLKKNHPNQTGQIKTQQGVVNSMHRKVAHQQGVVARHRKYTANQGHWTSYRKGMVNAASHKP